MKITVHGASETCVDAYTVLNDRNPVSSAAMTATRSSNSTRAKA